MTVKQPTPEIIALTTNLGMMWGCSKRSTSSRQDVDNYGRRTRKWSEYISYL